MVRISDLRGPVKILNSFRDAFHSKASKLDLESSARTRPEPSDRKFRTLPDSPIQVPVSLDWRAKLLADRFEIYK